MLKNILKNETIIKASDDKVEDVYEIIEINEEKEQSDIQRA